MSEPSDTGVGILGSGPATERDTIGELVVDFPRATLRDVTPEEYAEFWRRVEQHAAQYTSVTLMLPLVQVGQREPEPAFNAIESIKEGQRRAVEMYEQQRKEAASGVIDRLVWHPRKVDGDA